MKLRPKTSRAIAAALLLTTFAPALPLFGQTESTTDPVGIVELNVAGTTGTAAQAISFKAIGLTQPVLYQGSAESSTGNTTTLVDAEATWTDNLYNGAGGAVTHYVEIVSGPGTGTTYDIVATSATAKSLTLSEELKSDMTDGASFKVRKHWTIGSVFGPANEGGLGGGTATTADQVQLYRSGGYVSYYYQTSGFGGVGWRKFGNVIQSAANDVIYPDDGMVIRRQQASGVTLTIAGAVKVGQTSVPVVTGFNLLANVYASGMTLASSNLYTGNASTGLAGGTTTSADQILIWNGTNGYDTYYYQTSGFGGTGWRKTGFPLVDASTAAIPSGNGFFIRRGGTAFNWVIPQHPANL